MSIYILRHLYPWVLFRSWYICCDCWFIFAHFIVKARGKENHNMFEHVCGQMTFFVQRLQIEGQCLFFCRIAIRPNTQVDNLNS